MFQIAIVSSLFEGKSLLKQHQMVKDVLKEDIKEMHGITIKTLSK
jgi:stress-induced morphogen